MRLQLLGALALIAEGVAIAAVALGLAVWRYRRRQRSHEPLWSRLLSALATTGLVIGFVYLGVYFSSPPFPQIRWMAQVAAAGFAAAVIGYAITLTPTIWRALSAD